MFKDLRAELRTKEAVNASLSFALGQITWTYYESIRGIEVPFPGWADAGYLGTYPFLIAGVVLLSWDDALTSGRTHDGSAEGWRSPDDTWPRSRS